MTVTKVYGFLIVCSFFIEPGNAQPSQAAAYKAAANAFRSAAEKYKCPETRQWCIKNAEWNECMVAQLGGSKTSCREITTPMPPCNEQEGQVDTNNPTSTSKNGSDLTESFNAGNAASNAYQAAINAGKKQSGAILDATLAATGQLSDAGSIKTVVTIGGILSILNYFAERKEERLKAQQEAKRAMKELFSQRNDVLNFLEQADFSHSTGSLYVKRNKKGLIKSIEFSEGLTKSYDYVSVENSADSVRILLVERANINKGKVDIIKEYRFSINDISSCNYNELKLDFSYVAGNEVSDIPYITPIDIKELANAISEGNVGYSSIATGIYVMNLGLKAFKYREFQCLDFRLKESFIDFFSIPFQNSTNGAELYFGNKEDGNQLYKILITFTY